MLDNYSSLKKHQIYQYLLSNLIVIKLLLLVLMSLIIIELTYTSPSTFRTKFVDTQSNAYIQEEFNQSRWYSLVDSIDATEKQVTLNTYIFPDKEGRLLATEIVKDLRAKGVQGEISIYGRNMSNRLLVKSKE